MEAFGISIGITVSATSMDEKGILFNYQRMVIQHTNGQMIDLRLEKSKCLTKKMLYSRRKLF